MVHIRMDSIRSCVRATPHAVALQAITTDYSLK